MHKSVAALCIALTVHAVQAAEAAKKTDPKGSPPIKEIVIPIPPAPPSARIIEYRPKDIVSVKTKLRFTTIIVLNEKERILDYTCGDREFWVVDGSNNLAYVKPAKSGASTNLNLVTASGNIYSFLLAEVSDSPNTEPDLKVYVNVRDEGMRSTTSDAPKFVSADEADTLRAQVAEARKEASKARSDSEAAIEAGKAAFIANMRFPYRFQAGQAPFRVRAMAHDGKFTYIQARPDETPTLYEIADKIPSLVNFTYRDGLYVVNKVLGSGYLAIGKKKFKFEVEE